MGLIKKIFERFREKRNQRILRHKAEMADRHRAEMADRIFCLAASYELIKGVMEDYEKTEDEYEQNPEWFENVTYFKNGKPHLSTNDDKFPELDIEHVIDFINTIDDNLSGIHIDDIDDGVPKELMEIAMCLDGLPHSVSILPKRKIAVKKIKSDNPE